MCSKQDRCACSVVAYTQFAGPPWLSTWLRRGDRSRSPPPCVCYAGALENGTIQIWEASGNFGRSAALEHVPVARAQQALFGVQTWRYAAASRHVIRAAQPPGREVTSLTFLADGVTLLTRCDDDTLKIWDVRLLKAAVHVWELPISHTHTRMAVSPSQDLVLTGAPRAQSRLCMRVLTVRLTWPCCGGAAPGVSRRSLTLMHFSAPILAAGLPAYK